MNKHNSESFRVNAVVSFSGGLQDAYTYNVRGGVFANAQTGNVVLMSQNLMQGNWEKGIRYMFPIIFFAMGIFLADRIEASYKSSRVMNWRQIILIMEAAILGVVFFLPAEWNMIANIAVSFTCAMQVHSFNKFHGYSYASTMCIGNIRSGTESLSRYLENRDKESLYKTLHFFGIILIFAVGAGVGGILSGMFGQKAIAFSSVLLIAAAWMI